MNFMEPRAAALAALLLIASCPMCAQAAVRVNAANDEGPWNGKSWATAYRAVQDGIDAAQEAGGGEVWVAKGTYKPTSGTDRTVSFQWRPGVELYGGFGGAEARRTSAIGPGTSPRCPATSDARVISATTPTTSSSVRTGLPLTASRSQRATPTRSAAPAREGRAWDPPRGAAPACAVRGRVPHRDDRRARGGPAWPGGGETAAVRVNPAAG